MEHRKKTNGFEKSIFGIDLMIIWIIKQISEKRKNKKANKNSDSID